MAYERENKIIRLLDEHYPKEISFLPVISPFRFLLTVMLSASTTDRQAEKAAENLFSSYPACRNPLFFKIEYRISYTIYLDSTI